MSCLCMLCIPQQWVKTIKKKKNSTQNKSETQRARAYKVTSFLSTDCELSTETCSKNVYSPGPICNYVSYIMCYVCNKSFCLFLGRQTAHDIAAFAKESSQTPARVLGPKDFPHPVSQSGKPWFVDFFAPVRTFIWF